MHFSFHDSIGDSNQRGSSAINKTTFLGNPADGIHNDEDQHAIHFADSHEEFEKMLREAGVKEEPFEYSKSQKQSQYSEHEEDFDVHVQETNRLEDTIESDIHLNQNPQQISSATTSPIASATGFLRSTDERKTFDDSAKDGTRIGVCTWLFATALLIFLLATKVNASRTIRREESM